MPSKDGEEGSCKIDADDDAVKIIEDGLQISSDDTGSSSKRDNEDDSLVKADPLGPTEPASPSENTTFCSSRRKYSSRIASQTTIEGNVHDKYPQDCYSFVALNGPEKGKPWTRQKATSFLFGLLPFIFQMFLLVLLAYSQTNELRGTIGETDNPDQNKKEFMGLFAKFIPANSTPIIRLAQVVSLAAYVIFPSSSLQDVVRAVQLFPYFTSRRATDHPVSWLRVSCVLRATQGIAAMVVTVLLVLKSVTVVDIILNFTAVNFISGLDEDAFFLAMTGDFSPSLKIEANRIAATDLPLCIYKKDESRWKCYKLMTSLVYLFLFAMVAFLFAAQNSKSVWVTKLLRVQFQGSTGLNEYSGCFQMNTAPSSVEFSRRTYHSFDTGSLNTSFVPHPMGSHYANSLLSRL